MPLDDRVTALRHLLSALPQPAAIISADGRAEVLARNESAEKFGFGLVDELPPGVRVLDAEGAPLATKALPCTRAARGEHFHGWQLRWEMPEGTHIVVAHAEPLPPGALDRAASLVMLDEVYPGDLLAGSDGAARDAFLAYAAHELRSPLSALQLLLQRLRRSARKGDAVPSAEVLERVGPALRQAERLQMLVQNLLDLGGLRSHGLHLDHDELDLADLVHDVCERWMDVAGQAGSPLVLLRMDPVRGWFDRVRLEQVMTNLLSNAIKYGEGRAIEVSVEATGSGWARLVVADHGRGIPLPDREQIFQPLQRQPGNYRSQGLGLGLHVTREIVRAHGGRVTYSPRPGRGSIFTIELPVRDAPPETSTETTDA